MMKKCPYCAEDIKVDAIKCRYCGSWLDKNYLKNWTRSRKHAKLLGICAGLARHSSIPVVFIRLAFIILTFMGGWGLLLYLALWFLMPWDSEEPEE
jgi:phage shock protein PspC (stress-responsive transcriptional regulator)